MWNCHKIVNYLKEHRQSYIANHVLQKTKLNAMKITNVRADGNKVRTGKEWS